MGHPKITTKPTKITKNPFIILKTIIQKVSLTKKQTISVIIIINNKSKRIESNEEENKRIKM